MKPYLSRVDGPIGARQFSIINDNLWGSIRVSELERCLIDSPLLQRLRLIRQLGAAYLVYPSAVHSRFDHSLGALHRASIIMDVLVGASEDKPAGSLLASASELAQWRGALRVGALLHDVGHVFFSHAGERALTDSGLPGVSGRIDDLLVSAAQALQCERGKLALCDLFSYAIIDSKSIRDLCNKFDSTIASKLSIVAAALIHSRVRVPARERWIGDVLSGPLDVDKQDYVPRDSLMAGVGVQVEPHRCAEVLRVCDLKGATIVNDGKASIEDDERRIVITFSGITVVEDMLLSRMSLTLRVYRHHKVRLAERIAQKAYDYATRQGLLGPLLDDNVSIAGILDLSDSAFSAGEIRRRLVRQVQERQRQIADLDPNSIDRSVRAARAAKQGAAALEQELQSRKVLARLLELLEDRRLPVRAFAYGSRFAQADAEVPVGASRAGAEPWPALLEAMMDPTLQLKLEEDIVSVTKKLMSLDSQALDDESTVLLEASVYADVGPVKPVDLSPLYVYSHANERELVAYDKLFQPSQWLDALRDSKLICYVYAPRVHAHYVNVAAELVFAREFGAFSRNLRNAYSRCDRKDVDELKEKLFSKFETDLLNRSDPPIDGLWSVLTPPSFLSASAQRTYRAFLKESFLKKEALLREHSGRVVSFYKRSFEEGAELFGIHVDLIGSSKIVKALDKSVDEADARLLMLQALQRFILTNASNANASFLPLKTAGDAVVCIAACVESNLEDLVTALRNLTFDDGWKNSLNESMASAGWVVGSVPTPLLRVTVCRGRVKWHEELHDILGTDVTAMFVLEPDLKREGGDGPMIAWLGEWASVVGPTSKRVELNHVKVGTVVAYIEVMPKHRQASE